MKAGNYHGNSYKMMWNINDSIIACTMRYVKDSPGVDDLSKLGRMD